MSHTTPLSHPLIQLDVLLYVRIGDMWIMLVNNKDGNPSPALFANEGFCRVQTGALTRGYNDRHVAEPVE